MLSSALVYRMIANTCKTLGHTKAECRFSNNMTAADKAAADKATQEKEEAEVKVEKVQEEAPVKVEG
ncbi:hypothetical protein KCU65_g8227, partial [Aureobasidium melanogenum]